MFAEPRSRSTLVAVLALFFVSGATGLVFQAIWMRELSLLFGSTAQAAAAALAAFFLGLAAGSAFWGRRCARLQRPLRAYGQLELAVAVTALGMLALLPAFHLVYGLLYDGAILAAAERLPTLLPILKLALALALLFPAAFFMGGTLPILSHYLAPAAAAQGMRVPLLYGMNTVGGAVGAFVAAFVLPQWLGWRWTYGLAMLSVAAVGLAALWLESRLSSGLRPGSQAVPDSASHPPGPLAREAGSVRGAQAQGLGISEGSIRTLAFLSGCCALGLEVLWTRMFAQVLHNSVYSFAAILIAFLVALGAGALLAGWLAARSRLAPVATIALLLTLSGLAVAVSPLLFARLTDGLGYLGVGSGWQGYLGVIFGHVALVVLPPALVLGTLFPYLLRLATARGTPVGATVGALAALNTLGAIAGSLTAGFLLLDWLGLWRSIQLLAGLYLVAAVLLVQRSIHGSRPATGVASSDQGPLVRATAILPLLGLLALLSVLDASRLPVVPVDPLGRGESLYQAWEGSGGTVAVVRKGDALAIKVDNHYTLGDTAGRGFEERQAHFPLLLHPDPRSVFFIGLGTGITAGAALRHPVERVWAAELLPDAITAARTYFQPWQNGLFTDPRAQVIAVDGRNHLTATAARFDVIVGDLFVPWKAGTGGLYTRGHFLRVRERLQPGGLFAQWLPLYQLTEREFGIITRTFLDVFPQVTLWRGDFLPRGPIIALVGQVSAEPLDPVGLLGRAEQLVADDPGGGIASLLPAGTPPLLLYYAGNLSQARALFEHWPQNTDARPLIELDAPRSQREVAAGAQHWLTGAPLLALFERLLERSPPDADPYLAALSDEQRGAVGLGLHIFRQRFAEDSDRREPVGQTAFAGPRFGASPAAPAAANGPDDPVTGTRTLRAQLESLRRQRDLIDASLRALDQ